MSIPIGSQGDAMVKATNKIERIEEAIYNLFIQVEHLEELNTAIIESNPPPKTKTNEEVTPRRSLQVILSSLPDNLGECTERINAAILNIKSSIF